MKKLLGRNVIYLSKQALEVDTNQAKFFPFLRSSLISSTAHEEIIVKGIHAMCNLTNVRDVVPHKQPFQEFVFFGRSNVGKSSSHQ